MDQKYYFSRQDRRSQNKTSFTEKFMDKIAPGMKELGPLGPELDLVDTLENQLTRVDNSAYWGKNLKEIPFAVFDLETTGLHPFGRDEIISMGAVLIDDQQLTGRAFHQLVNPRRSIPSTAVKITGITPEKVKDQPPVEHVLAQFLDFIGSRVLVAHHASFDLAFLNLKLGEMIGKGLPHPVIDTARLARCLEPSLEENSLENLCRYYRVNPERRHTALGDSLITARIFLKLFPGLADEGIENLGELARMYYLSLDDRFPRYPLII